MGDFAVMQTPGPRPVYVMWISVSGDSRCLDGQATLIFLTPILGALLGAEFHPSRGRPPVLQTSKGFSLPNLQVEFLYF